MPGRLRRRSPGGQFRQDAGVLLLALLGAVGAQVDAAVLNRRESSAGGLVQPVLRGPPRSRNEHGSTSFRSEG